MVQAVLDGVWKPRRWREPQLAAPLAGFDPVMVPTQHGSVAAWRVANVDHLRSRQHQDGPCLAADLGQPDLASRQSSLQASASFQNGSGRSGRRSYAARSAWANAARASLGAN